MHAASPWRPHFAALSALAGAAPSGAAPDPADLVTPALARQAEPHILQWQADIDAMLAAATSLEEFREQLLARYSSLSTDELVSVLAHALVAIDLAGRSEVQDGR